jgi:Tfp pilus assembly protein PilF
VQLGMMALQKGSYKEGEKYMREALKGSLDNESQAMALLGMVQIYMNKRDIRASKDFLRRAKNCKAKNEQVVAQIKDLDKHLARVPG